MEDPTPGSTQVPTPIPPLSPMPGGLSGSPMAPLTTPIMATTYDLSSIPILKGKSNASAWLRAVQLSLRARRIWHLCEEGVVAETIRTNQSVADWLTPSLIARMNDTLQGQALT